MKRALLLGVVLLLGVIAGEILTRNFVFRAWLGRGVRRGDLQALVGTRGIYDRDAQLRRRSIESLIDEAKLDRVAAHVPIAGAAIDHEMELLRAQLPNDKFWDALLANAGTSAVALRREVAANLRSRAWLEAQLATAPSPSEQDERRYYEAHRAQFQEPLRFRASHLFLAAPIGYPDEVIEGKRRLINTLAARLKNGEAFPALVAEFSEDEATKQRAGDLNYFAEARMLPEVFAAAQTLQPGGTTAQPIRSRLGFHLLRLQDALPPQELDLARAAPEIATILVNQERARQVAAVVAGLR